MEPLSKALRSLQMTDDNILEIIYNDMVHVEYADMEELLNHIYHFTDNKPCKRLVVISPKATIEKEARKLLQEENHAKRRTILAEAVIVHSLAHKMMFNIYSKFIKDVYPSRYFTDIDDARAWLTAQS